MVEITVKQVTNKKEWELFLSLHEEANFLQSWYWGEFHKRLGQAVFYSGFFRGKSLVGVMLSVVESARRGRYMTVAGGPIIDWQDKEVVDAAFEEMKRIGKSERCVFVRIRPQLFGNQESGIKNPADTEVMAGRQGEGVASNAISLKEGMSDVPLVRKRDAKGIFVERGCVDAPMYLSAELTSQLDITPPEEDLLKNMRKTTRYEIKKAMSVGVKVEMSKDSTLIQAFYDLQMETAKRQKFVPFSYTFFLEQFQVFFEADKGLLYTAMYEDKVLAQAFVIFYGAEAAYHYGASTEDGRKYPGAYLIQWEAIKEAKRRGLQRYNFWGVAPIGESDHRFSGISLFKRGFGGEDVAYLHAQDLVINRRKYWLTLAIEKVRKIRRRV